MIQPAKDFILTEPIKIEREEKTQSGIIVAPKSEREDLIVAKATIVESASEKYKKGQVVYYNYFSGNTILIPSKDAFGKDDKEYHIVFEGDILAWEV